MLEHLKSTYASTRSPFFRVVKLQNQGIYDKAEANKLKDEGKIRKRRGVNGDLIELIEKE